MEKNHLKRQIEKVLQQEIIDRDIDHTFEHVSVNLYDRLNQIRQREKVIIGDYFTRPTDTETTRTKLLKLDYIEESWFDTVQLKQRTRLGDFQGIYVMYKGTKPFYVGRSNTVVKRIYDHINGKNDNTASLAFKFGRKLYYQNKQNPKLKNRRSLSFKDYCDPFQQRFMKFKIVFDCIPNDEELYLFELFASMELKTNLNRFRCH